MAAGASLAIRSRNLDLAKFSGDPNERVKALRMKAVVVRNQNSHRAERTADGSLAGESLAHDFDLVLVRRSLAAKIDREALSLGANAQHRLLNPVGALVLP